MRPDDILSTLGMTQPTTSSAVQPSQLDQLLLGNAIPRQEGAVKAIEGQMQQVAGAEDKSWIQKLRSPSGLAALLLALGGTAVAGPIAGLGVGAAMAGGNIGASGAQFEKNKSATEAELRKQLDDANTELDKTRQRVLQIVTTQPELLTRQNPVTGEIENVASPEVIGYYATGTDLAVNPVSKMAMNQRKDRWTQLMALSTTALGKARTKEDARVITRKIFDLLDYPSAPSDMVEAMVNTYGTPDFETTLGSMYLEHFGSSGISATVYAGENNLQLHDPRVVRMLVPPPPKDQTALDILNQQFLDASDKILAWAKTHPDETQRVRQETGSDNKLYLSTMAGLALDEADLGAYTTKISKDPNFIADWMRQYGMVNSEFSLIDMINSTKQLKATQNMTPEQVQQVKASAATERVQATREYATQASALSDLRQANGIAIRLQEFNLSDAQINGIVARIRETARLEATLPDGTVQLDKYNEVIRRETTAAVAEYSTTEEGK